MLIVGVTGRSGSGKSTVTRHYAALGHPTADGDAIAREVQQKGTPCLDELVQAFGAGILNADGTLARKKLGEIAFASPEKTRRLMEITHPHIRAEINRREEEARKNGAKLFFIDGAALVGGPFGPHWDRLVLVVSEQRLSISRIILRDGISKTAAQHRLDAQQPLDVLKAAADYIIENNGSEAVLLEEADAVLKKLLDEEARQP
ncbi:MAG: dephospho-CoA kinase [Oscillospiraceae bacterium]